MQKVQKKKKKNNSRLDEQDRERDNARSQVENSIIKGYSTFYEKSTENRDGQREQERCS